MPNFEQMRISLAPREPSPLFGDQEAMERSREKFLVDAFAERRDFLPYKGSAKISFLPIEAPDGYVAGYFGRQRRQKGHRGPDVAFAEADYENWEIALFVLRVSGNDQIQVAWMEYNPDVGSPKAVVEAFFKRLTRNSSFGEWTPIVKYMDSEGEYWAAVRNHRDRITSLSFTFLPPNALHMRQKVADFVKLASEQGHPNTQTHTYQSDPGQMDPESEIMAASADIALEGGGEAEIKVGKKKVYSSKNTKTVRGVDAAEMPTPTEPTFIKRVIARLWP